MVQSLLCAKAMKFFQLSTGECIWDYIPRGTDKPMNWTRQRKALCLAKYCWNLNWHLRAQVCGSVTGYLLPKTVHDKVKPCCTKFTEMSQHRSKIIFLPSNVYLYVSFCDKMYKHVKDWTCQMQDLLLSILRMSYKEINTLCMEFAIMFVLLLLWPLNQLVPVCKHLCL
jgi:hypothetical protein